MRRILQGVESKTHSGYFCKLGSRCLADELTLKMRGHRANVFLNESQEEIKNEQLKVFKQSRPNSYIQLWLTPFFPQINVLRTNPTIYHNFVLLFSQIFWCNGVGRFHTFEMIYTITVLLLEDAAVNSCLPPMSQLFYVIDDPFTHEKKS